MPRKKELNNYIEEQPDYSMFKNLTVGVLIAASVFFGGSMVVEKYQEKRFEESSIYIQKEGVSTLEYLKKSKEKINILYNKNNELIEFLQSNSNSEFLSPMGINLSSLKNQNELTKKQALDELSLNLTSSEKVINVLNEKDKEKQIDSFNDIYGDHFERFKNATANQSAKNQELQNLQSTLEKNLNGIKEIKKEVLLAIKERLKNSNFDFSVKSEEFKTIVTQEINDETKSINEIRKELNDDSELRNIVSPENLNDYDSALKEVSEVAYAQIISDQEKIKEIIQSMSPEQVEQELANVQNNNNSSGGFNYLFLHGWTSSSTSYSNSPSYSGSTVNNFKANNSNLYSIKNENSHFNKSIVNNPALSKKVNPNFIKNYANFKSKSAKISSAKSFRASRTSFSGGGRSFGG